MNRMWKWLLLVVAIVLIDQFTKGVIQSNYFLGESTPVIDGLFNITYVQNPGAAFGFMAGAHESIRRPLFLFIPVIACFWLIVLIWQQRFKDLLLGTAYTLIFAGALGNLIDRFVLGHVVDFLDFYMGSSHFPAFNIADSSITIAAMLLIYDFFINIKKKQHENK